MIPIKREQVKANIAKQFKTDTYKVYSNLIIQRMDGKVLFLKRSPIDSFCAGQWCLPGGKVEPGEDAVTAAVRETREETGLDIPQTMDMPFLKKVVDKEECKIYYCVFKCYVTQSIVLDFNEHAQYAWMTIDEALSTLDLLMDLREHLSNI
jgi:8-oxo-dGTP pyrophosphatase MutT (NUDIX family)